LTTLAITLDTKLSPVCAAIVRLLGLLSASNMDYVPINCVEAFTSYFTTYELSMGVPLLLVLLIVLLHAWRVRTLSRRFSRMNSMLWSNCGVLVAYIFYVHVWRVTNQVSNNVPNLSVGSSLVLAEYRCSSPQLALISTLSTRYRMDFEFSCKLS
jgi:cytochrome c biogenesis factor